MAKFSVVFSGILLVVAMAAIAEAGIITTTTFEDNPFGRQTGEDCAIKLAQQEMLSHCRMYITSSQGYQSPRSAFMNPAEEHMKFCCDQLQNMGKMCMCEGIKTMMNMQGWTQKRQMGQMASMAENLPMECGFMTQSCQMQAVWF